MRLLNLNRAQVLRKGKTENIRGKLITNDDLSLEISGTVQPERNLKLIREVFGSHIEGAIKVYSKTKLMTKEDGNGADVVTWDGRKYEVSESRLYTDIVPHYKMIAILIKDER